MAGLPLFTDCITAEEKIPPDDINAEPLSGSPHFYSVNIKFVSIDDVIVTTNIAAESLGVAHDSFTLSKTEWSYDSIKNTLFVKRDIDDTNYLVRIKGRYRTPLVIIPIDKIDPAQIRLVIDGKTGIKGTDYIYNAKKNEIELPSCRTGKEKYILQYNHSGGSASISSMSTSGLTRSLLQYMGWPTEGNTTSLDQHGLLFSPRSTRYKSVWLVQLIPSHDGYGGKDILKKFHWDNKNNILTLDEPVDTEKFSVMIFGEEL